MGKVKHVKICLDNFGSYLGRGEGCFIIRDKNKNETARYPHFKKEIGEVILKGGNTVSVNALIDLALWNIDTYVMTRRNRVATFLVNPENSSHVKTRICQYKTYLNNNKTAEIMKTILKTKIEGQNRLLNKYDLKTYYYPIERQIENTNTENLHSYRMKLMQIEARYSKYYFNEIFKLFPEKIRPKTRTTYRAYDGLNNVFNFGYYVLRNRVHLAILKAHLEPYLGFLHSIQPYRPSLVLDFIEIYRYLIDSFLVERSQKFHKKDFVLVTDFMMHLKMGKKIHLCEFETNELAEDLNKFFDRIVEIPRIKHGYRQTIDTLISEEALLFAKYLRNERKEWQPRIVMV